MLFTYPQLKVLSAVCSNLSVVWLGAFFVTKDPISLTMNIVYATMFWNYAVKAEEQLEKYDRSN